MNRSYPFRLFCLALAILILVLGTRLAKAADTPISGTYEVIKRTDAGLQVKVVVRFHLTNRGQSAVSLQGVLLSDFGYSPAKPAHGPSLTLAAGVSETTEEELIIPRAEFEQWQKGLRPRVILQLRTASGATTAQVIRLERTTARKGE